MRGKGASPKPPKADRRITPAHAGKSRCHRTRCACPWDHPRTCGEKTHARRAAAGRAGSPPHMRGKAAERRQLFQISGITPAHAGKRRPSTPGCAAFGDHPRTCGEKFFFFNAKLTIQGSPPHMRGKGSVSKLRHRVVRITPAHAGKRSPEPERAAAPWDHPRTCGEKTKKIP